MLLSLIVVGVCAAALYGLQRHLLFPAPKRNAILASPHHRIEAVGIEVNGKLLRGYLARPAIDTGDPLRSLLYFNGRRENPTSIFRALAELPNHEVLCFFYDGLGLGWHKPGEKEPVADGLAVLDGWARERGVRADRIDVAGRSLGSGIAVQVAATRPVRRLVLISPHDRLISAVRVILPGWPGWWLRDPFDSVAHIDRVACPCLLVAGDRDRTIPLEISRALFRFWKGPLTEVVIHGSGHRGLLRRAEVHRALADFLG